MEARVFERLKSRDEETQTHRKRGLGGVWQKEKKEGRDL